MGTTGLVVELLVVGAGASAWLSLLVLAFLDYTWLPNELGVDPLITLMLLPIVYVLGLVVDRFANRLLAGSAWRIRSARFGSHEEFQKARVAAAKSPHINPMFDYGRSRLRVCRGWALNSAVLLVVVPVFVWWRLPGDVDRVQLTLVGEAVLSALCAACLFAWYDLLKAESDSLHRIGIESADGI